MTLCSSAGENRREKAVCSLPRRPGPTHWCSWWARVPLATPASLRPVTVDQSRSLEIPARADAGLGGGGGTRGVSLWRVGAWRLEAPPLSLALSRGSGLHGGDCGKARASETPLPPAQPETWADSGGCPWAPHSLDESEKSRECVCVRALGAPAGRLGRAPRRARQWQSRLPPPLYVTLCRPRLNKGAFVPSLTRPLPACRLASLGLAGVYPRGPVGRGSPRGAGKAAGAPLPPGTPLAGSGSGPRPPSRSPACWLLHLHPLSVPRVRSPARRRVRGGGWEGHPGEHEVARSLAFLARCLSNCSRVSSPIPFQWLGLSWLRPGKVSCALGKLRSAHHLIGSSRSPEVLCPSFESSHKWDTENSWVGILNFLPSSAAAFP